MKKNIVLTLLLFCAALSAQNWEPLFNGKT